MTGNGESTPSKDDDEAMKAFEAQQQRQKNSNKLPKIVFDLAIKPSEQKNSQQGQSETPPPEEPKQ